MGEPWRLSTNARTPKPPAGIFIIPVAGSENLFHLAWESLGEWEVWLVGNLSSMHPTCSECFDTSKASRCGQEEILALGRTGNLSRQITPRRAARFKRSEGRAEASGPLAAWPQTEATRSALITTAWETQRRTAPKSREPENASAVAALLVVIRKGDASKGETWALTTSRASNQQPEVRAAGDERGDKGRPLGPHALARGQTFGADTSKLGRLSAEPPRNPANTKRGQHGG